jgi:hypothetical protein
MIPPLILYAGVVMSHSGPLTDVDKTRMLDIANGNRNKPPRPVATGEGDSHDRGILLVIGLLVTAFLASVAAILYPTLR